MIIFWVTRPIKFVALKYGAYKSSNVKVDYEIDVLDKLKNYLKTKDNFVQDWEKIKDSYISISSTKRHIRNQIKFIDNRDKKKCMESLCTDGKFSFTYNGITNNNSNPSHDIKEFW